MAEETNKQFIINADEIFLNNRNDRKSSHIQMTTNGVLGENDIQFNNSNLDITSGGFLKAPDLRTNVIKDVDGNTTITLSSSSIDFHNKTINNLSFSSGSISANSVTSVNGYASLDAELDALTTNKVSITGHTGSKVFVSSSGGGLTTSSVTTTDLGKLSNISITQNVDLDNIETYALNSLQFGGSPGGDVTVGGGVGSYGSDFKFRGDGLVGSTIYHATMKLPNVLGSDITLTLPGSSGTLSTLALGTTSSTALVGNTPLLALGTTSSTALAGDTPLLALGTTSSTALVGNTPLLALGTTGTTALAGDNINTIISHTSSISDLEGDVAANTLQHTNTSYVVGQQVIEQALMKLKTDRISVTQSVDLDTMESNISTNNAKNGISGTQASNILTNNAKNGISGTQATQLSTLNSHFGTSGFTYSNWRTKNSAMGCFGSTISTSTTTGTSGYGYMIFDTRDGSLPGNAGVVYPVVKTNYVNMYFSVYNVYVGYLTSGNIGRIDFTGQHQALPVNEDLFNNIDDYIGKIVISNGDVSSIVEDVSHNYFIKTGKEGITINESIPRVVLCNTYKDKRVFGVISPEEEDDNIKNMPNRQKEKHFKQGAFVTVLSGLPEDDNRIIINALGEGAIWVINSHGNITNGDYICSSDKGEGYGCLQDDDLLHNYTCAKATIDCCFDLTSNDYECKEILVNGENLKIAFIACTYSF